MRGDIHLLKPPRGARGRAQQGERYAVVVQSDVLPLATWLVAPTSRDARDASFRPPILVAGVSTAVLVEQTAAVDPRRLGRVVGHLTRDELDAVDAALRTVLGLAR